ncbi:bifunctional molybdenum cofactor biosynthesis protein MoaC/MoaB [Candidatus Acetothermia bacterium]|nr:bifunctional molybdenum cofactor biosynthesis protein MoaC/MoaB [Candidatus Acetothermia bacterium]MBI3644159.1 bifunctional molybdenum cofactor biosynthesis protein MoaC/MoaB [Candidatus Acetothermia bacterium]
MRDISHKVETLREALAETWISVPGELQPLLEQGKTEKGDALEIARAAGIMAAKRTWELIPLCHPIPVFHVEIKYHFEKGGLRIQVRVKSIASTGVEMEALTAASITALTVYDMLKPYNQEIEIGYLKLVSKTGGKSDYREKIEPPIKTAVIVLSDSVASGKKEDRAGEAVIFRLEADKNVEILSYEILPDDAQALAKRVKELVNEGADLLLTVGGTGLSHTDITVETLQPLIEREIPGLMEAARNHGQKRTRYSMLSRGIAGMIGDTLVITMPGSTKGAKETFDALFPAVLHIFQVLRKIPHKHGYS